MGRLCYYDEDAGFVPYTDEPEPQKPQTNADRIRAMSDEKLAEWIVHKTEGNGFKGYEISVKAWLDWLREESK